MHLGKKVIQQKQDREKNEERVRGKRRKKEKWSQGAAEL